MRKCTKKWTQKDGTKIRICDMSDRHLGSTIEMVRQTTKKQYDSLVACTFGAAVFFDGEAQQLALERQLDALESDGPIPSMFFPLYPDLVLEQYRRNTLMLRQ